jgi:hypothetical protein
VKRPLRTPGLLQPEICAARYDVAEAVGIPRAIAKYGAATGGRGVLGAIQTARLTDSFLLQFNDYLKAFGGAIGTVVATEIVDSLN